MWLKEAACPDPRHGMVSPESSSCSEMGSRAKRDMTCRRPMRVDARSPQPFSPLSLLLLQLHPVPSTNTDASFQQDIVFSSPTSTER